MTLDPPHSGDPELSSLAPPWVQSAPLRPGVSRQLPEQPVDHWWLSHLKNMKVTQDMLGLFCRKRTKKYKNVPNHQPDQNLCSQFLKHSGIFKRIGGMLIQIAMCMALHTEANLYGFEPKERWLQSQEGDCFNKSINTFTDPITRPQEHLS